MLKKFLKLLLIFATLSSCKSSKRAKVITKKSDQVESSTKKTRSSKRKSTKVPESSESTYSLAETIINTAKEYNGVRYKYGGTTSKGMDCSGLITTAFKKENIELPRTSLAMSKEGKRIDLDDVQKGDLLFFQTNKSKKVVNHVGLVVETQPGLIEFIHATSSKGVLISSLNQNYWRLAFYEARRVL